MRSSKMVRLVVMSVLLCGASTTATSTAQAWTTNGPLSFTATAPSALLTISSSPAVAATCSGIPAPGNRVTGTLNASGAATPFNAGTVNLTFTGCTAGGLAMTLTCQPAQLWFSSYAAPVATGEIRGVNCALTFPSLPGCTVTFTGNGPVGRAFVVTYNNTTGQLTLLNPVPPHAQQQTLNASWTAACIFFAARPGAAPARWSAPSGAALVYTITSTPRPTITNP